MYPKVFQIRVQILFYIIKNMLFVIIYIINYYHALLQQINVKFINKF